MHLLKIRIQIISRDLHLRNEEFEEADIGSLVRVGIQKLVSR
jgi:hypothetical protein